MSIRAKLPLFLIALFALAVACGDETVNVNPDGGGSGGAGGAGGTGGSGGTGGTGGAGGGTGGTGGTSGSTDAGPNSTDAAPPGCTPTGTQCNNCIDDDSDGLIDGFDPHCISGLDNDESSFATGIPGDNRDENKQDCFFDGDSGGGNDGCDIPTCCLLNNCTDPNTDCSFDPANDSSDAMCVEFCGAVTPPGCDCFSCCTICDTAGQCNDVLLNPAVAPNCDIDVLGDPALCPPCTKVAECSTTCEPEGCILCPGQSEEDLPAECMGSNECPDGLTPCSTSAECDTGEYCSAGCCIFQIG